MVVTVIIVVLVFGAFTIGHGGTIVVVFSAALVTAVVGEGVRAGLRYRPRKV